MHPTSLCVARCFSSSSPVSVTEVFLLTSVSFGLHIIVTKAATRQSPAAIHAAVRRPPSLLTYPPTAGPPNKANPCTTPIRPKEPVRCSLGPSAKSMTEGSASMARKGGQGGHGAWLTRAEECYLEPQAGDDAGHCHYAHGVRDGEQSVADGRDEE